MANKKITELSISSNPPLSGSTVVVYSGETQQATLSTLRTVLVDSGSHTFTGNQTINGNVLISGSLTAQGANFDIISGSTNFGENINDLHKFTGKVMIGSSSFVDGEIFHVKSQQNTTTTAYIEGNSSYYTQLNFKNSNSGSNASGDIVVTANNGTDSIHFVDLGINSSTYTAGVVGNQNDAYLFNAGRSLYVGTIGGSPNQQSNLYLFALNNWEQPQIMVSGSKQIGFNTVSVSPSYMYGFSGSAYFNNDLKTEGTIATSTAILSSVSSSLNFADDAAAAIGGVPLGGLYRSGSLVMIRIN